MTIATFRWITLICTCLLAHSAWSYELTEARLERLGDGEVLRRLEKIKDSDEHEGIALGVIDTSKQHLIEVLMDARHYPKYMPNTEFTKITETFENGLIIDTKLDMPWPIADVEYSCKMLRENDIIHFNMVEGTGKGVKNFEGSWKAQTFQDNPKRTLLEYRLIFVPDRWYPGWARRIATNATLGKIIKQVRERVKELQSSKTKDPL